MTHAAQTIDQWRARKAREWKQQATFNASNGMHLMAEQADMVAEAFLAGQYDPPMVANPAVQVCISSF